MSKSVALLLFLIFLTASCVVTIKPARASENSWITRPPMLESAGMAVAVDGKIYAIGAITQEYDPVALTWTKKASMPNPIGGGVAVYQNEIYVIGDSQNQVYDIATDTWASKTAMPTWRIGVQANVVDDKIYLIGGMSDTESGTITNVNEAYDPATNTWSTKESIPTPVYTYASAVVDNKIYIIGGSAEPPNVVLDLVQIYDPENDSWTTGTSMPTPIRYASAAATTGLFAPKRIYVIGGLQNSYGLNITQVYDPQTDSWTTGASMPTARYNLGLAVINDTIYAMGGVLLPPYAFPKEPLTTNEVYLPFGYEGPLPPYWSPPPSPSSSPSPSPSPTPTASPSPTPKPSQEPTSTPKPQQPEPFPTTLVIASIITVAVIGVGLLVYFKKRKLGFLRDIPFATFELVVIVVGVVLVLASVIGRPLKNSEYVPNAVTGFVTMTGILSAFTGFWLTHLYTTSNGKTKEWLVKRIAIIVFAIGLSLMSVLGSLSQLVFGSIEAATQQAIFGTDLILLADLEVVFMTMYKAFWKRELGDKSS